MDKVRGVRQDLIIASAKHFRQVQLRLHVNRQGIGVNAHLSGLTDGLPHVSTFTIWAVLRDAGWSWQHTRTWCRTGIVTRKRKNGTVEVIDPDTLAKKT